MKRDLYIGIDIGGQSSKCGVVEADGNILAQRVITSLQEELELYLSDLCNVIAELREETEPFGHVKGIGIGAPNANYYTGTIEHAPNIRWCRDVSGATVTVPIAQLISKRVGLPVRITNDANAAAMGEMIYGSAKGMKNFIMLTLGTGVGSGIVVDGKLLYGHDGFAGELGHICAVENGRACNCGLKGCLETYASAMGVARSAMLRLQEAPANSSLLQQLDINSITSKDIFSAAQQGDALAIEIFNDTGRILGRSMADFVKFSAPEAIILFGGLTKSREFFHEAMVKSMNEHLMQIWRDKIKIIYSSLKDSDAAILGASALAYASSD